MLDIEPAIFKCRVRRRGPAEEAGGVGLHAGGDVLVDGHGEGGAAVTEALADDLHVNAGLEQDRGVGVAEVLEPDPR